MQRKKQSEKIIVTMTMQVFWSLLGSTQHHYIARKGHDHFQYFPLPAASFSPLISFASFIPGSSLDIIPVLTVTANTLGQKVTCAFSPARFGSSRSQMCPLSPRNTLILRAAKLCRARTKSKSYYIH